MTPFHWVLDTMHKIELSDTSEESVDETIEETSWLIVRMFRTLGNYSEQTNLPTSHLMTKQTQLFKTYPWLQPIVAKLHGLFPMLLRNS